MKPRPLTHRARLLDQIEDPAVQKIIVMRWFKQGVVDALEAEQLIRGRGIASA